jgi:hypothetical protein
VSNWLRPDAATSPERLFCHVYGRGKGQAQMIPGWPYPQVTTNTETSRYGTARTAAWDRVHPRLARPGQAARIEEPPSGATP